MRAGTAGTAGRLAAAVTLVVLSACSAGDDPQDGWTPVAGDRRITPEAVEAVSLEHLPTDPTGSYSSADPDEGSVSADVDYGDDAGGVHVVVRDSAPDDDEPCDESYWDGCEEEDVAGGTLLYRWQEEEPEEDPGILVVAMLRDDGDWVSVYYAGEPLGSDPREQDLDIPVGAMVDVVTDPRLSPTTSRDVLALGLPFVDPVPPPPETERLTPEAVVGIVMESVPERLEGARRIDRRGVVGAELRYGTRRGAEELLEVEVQRSPRVVDPCAEPDLAGCRPVDPFGDDEIVVAWRYPDEGGTVVEYVLARPAEPADSRVATLVRVVFRTDRVVRDPLVRRGEIQDLRCDLWTYIVTDSRLTPRTTPAAVRLGRRVDPSLFE